MLTGVAFELLILAALFTHIVVIKIKAVSGIGVFGYVGHDWFDWVLISLFTVYTVEIAAKMAVAGVFLDADTTVADFFYNGLRQHVRDALDSTRRVGLRPADDRAPAPAARTLLRHESAANKGSRLTRLPFMRSSWNRLDLAAVACFWLYLAVTFQNPHASQYSRVLSAGCTLKLLHLLNITNGTATVLRSLKRAAPLLVDVFLFILVFCVLFAVVGVQAFSGSLRRQCVWVDPLGVQDNYTWTLQFCGGYEDPLDPARALPFVYEDGRRSSQTKGFICPAPSVCVSAANPYNNTVSFDNIANSLELTFVLMGENGFSDLMNYMADSEHLIASLFFVAAVIVLAWWLMNLFVAVITSTFALIGEETRHSAFAKQEPAANAEPPRPRRRSTIGERVKTWPARAYRRTRGVWTALILADFVVECSRTAATSESARATISVCQYVTTIALDFEIALRFLVSLPDWRKFAARTTNRIDVALAAITSAMFLRAISQHDDTYAWLSVFQIARFYRLVMTSAYVRGVWAQVVGRFASLLNLALFLGLIIDISAIMLFELLNGDILAEVYGEQTPIMYTSFADALRGSYQIMATEGWAPVLYTITSSQTRYGISWLSAIFVIGWFFFSNGVVMNMFIAVVSENFGVSEKAKRAEQIRAFIRRNASVATTSQAWSLTHAFTSRRGGRRASTLTGPVVLDMMAREQVIRDVSASAPEQMLRTAQDLQLDARPSRLSLAFWRARLAGRLRRNPFFRRADPLDVPDVLTDVTFDKLVEHARQQQTRERRKYIAENPRFNTALYVLGPRHPLRRLCQRIVGPAYGERYDGVTPTRAVSYAFQGLILFCVVSMVVSTCVTTPYYRRNYYLAFGEARLSWMSASDLAFVAVFTLEALIKIAADGLAFTPNGYMRSSWNLIDFVVLWTLWTTTLVTLRSDAAGTRWVRTFKALRALRLLHVSENAKATFHDIIIVGIGKIAGAAIVGFSLLIPFALWGMNLLMGKMLACNDGDNERLAACTGEYTAAPFAWAVRAPRSYRNPSYSFDSFGDALSILYQIMSLEGWTNVLQSAQDVVGVGLNPQFNYSIINGVYVYVFNFTASVLISTFFVAVIMQNYTKKTGKAFLTSDQRAFMEMRKMLATVNPSRRRARRPAAPFAAWCYDQTMDRTSRWNRLTLWVLFGNIVLLCLEYYPAPAGLDLFLKICFLLSSLVTAAHEVVWVVGISWARYAQSTSLRRLGSNLWLVGWHIAVMSCVSLSVVNLVRGYEVLITLKKLLFVVVSCRLLLRSNRLNQLLRSASASLGNIASLLYTWFILFVIYAIAFNQLFGLTRLGDNGSATVNFRTIPKSLLLLFRMSCGEGWNSVMVDYMVEAPLCNDSANFYDNDCGSRSYASALFMSWNIISMYIFTNMFISLVYENFSYVYQRSSMAAFFDRGELRAFKRAWARFDPEGKGYIARDDLGRLLQALTGVYAMRIHDSPWLVSELLPIAAPEHAERGAASALDVDALNLVLARLPVAEIQARRERYERLYSEIMHDSMGSLRGIAFDTVLTLIPYYKELGSTTMYSCLTLDQFLQRRAKLVRIDDEIKRKKVIAWLTMV
ncbi:Ion transport protein-domain-containing protein [Dipodascopsis tothii]|uniref:Ion transport protein-domain-containing protein n=1 Tax=Dipodascopsis tothii TaxID=44089 RepID=UPI0034CFF578